MLRGFATISFYATDLEAATRWYTEVLGIEPYFNRKNPDGSLGYVEFRVGDYQHELGIIDSRYAPAGRPDVPSGAVTFWHVDDLQGAFDRLLSLGAEEYEPPVERGAGFVTASVVDPFGNILGVMYNPHYVEMLKMAPAT
ncbi:VOC family protein [Planobispora siamensis]|uniref:Glyoxalase n=1 Tax=Planobispora siamensis TaxID=936338 RepID=A0A8J3SGK7_9ACTN|nr:VOC family protein [Planobispora siamensis]GIH94181.1 glyoxalase [Planobispora siamensis]